MHPLRVKRFFLSISLDELGSKTGLDQGKLSRIERGYVKPQAHEMESIAKVLGCQADEIFPAEAVNDNE